MSNCIAPCSTGSTNTVINWQILLKMGAERTAYILVCWGHTLALCGTVLEMGVDNTGRLLMDIGSSPCF